MVTDIAWARSGVNFEISQECFSFNYVWDQTDGPWADKISFSAFAMWPVASEKDDHAFVIRLQNKHL